MRDTLPKKPKNVECAIINLDITKNEGTHWVAYVKVNNRCEYFDSFGDLKPPLEFIKYMKGVMICYNYVQFQNYDTVNCGHLCIEFLRRFWKSQ